MIDELTIRQREILRSVVQSFIQLAVPVGSKRLSEHYFPDLSPATIRGVLADLEERGYIDHPHTSAGRVPTDLGYRTYVDNLMVPEGLAQTEKQRLEQQLRAAVEAGEILQITGKVLGNISHQLSIVSLPYISTGVLERIELVRVSTTRLLVILTMKSGLIRTITMEVVAEIPSEKLHRVSSSLNERLAGLTLKTIRDSFRDRTRDLDDDDTGLIRMFVISSQKLFDDEQDQNRLLISGTKNMLKQPEFDNPDRVRTVFEIVENEEFVVHVLEQNDGHSQHGGVKVTIGRENNSEELANFSLIVAMYRVGDVHGRIALLGPKRMNYAQSIPLVEFAASTVTETLN
jgi:heat-inducible transcriptional repressor